MFMPAPLLLAGTAPTASGIGDPEALHGTWWDTHNFDAAGADLSDAQQEEFRDAIEERLRGVPWKGIREGWGNQAAHPSPLTPPAWLVAARDHPAMAERRIILQPSEAAAPGKPGTAAGSLAAQAGASLDALWASHAAWIRNVKWNQDRKLAALPGVRVVLRSNEQDNIGIGSVTPGSTAGELAVDDFPAGTGAGQRLSADGITLALKRQVLLARAAKEQMLGIDVPSGARTTAFPAHCAGPACAFPVMRKPTSAEDPRQNAAQIWDLTQLADTFNGEILRWYDAVATHNHRVHTRIEGYNNAAPPEQQNCLYNLWRFQERCLSYWPASERRYVPLMVTECGTYWDSQNGTWNGGPIYIPTTVSRGQTWFQACEQNIKLREYRDAMQFCMMLWNGAIIEAKYATCHTKALSGNRWDFRPDDLSLWPTLDGGDGRHFKPLPDWAALVALRNEANYDHGRNNFPGVFPTKAWTDFAKASSWAVYFNMSTAPTGTPLTSPPTVWWQNVFMGTDGVEAGTMEMRGWGAGTAIDHRNMAVRPVWLAHPSREHLFRVKVNFPTSNANARAKIRVRGHDKLYGIRNLEVEVIGNDAAATGSNWKTIELAFRHTGHGLAHLDPVNYALLCCDHNAVGTVRWKEPELLVA